MVVQLNARIPSSPFGTGKRFWSYCVAACNGWWMSPAKWSTKRKKRALSIFLTFQSLTVELLSVSAHATLDTLLTAGVASNRNDLT